MVSIAKVADRLHCRNGLHLAQVGGLALLVGLSTSVIAEQSRPAPCVLEPGPTGSVAQVLDGETLVLDDGTEVRLIGALTPRAPDHGTAIELWPPAAAARAALADVAMGRSVDLAYPAGPRLDRYGRHLAHVFVHTADGRTWVQGHLLEHGHARAYRLASNAGCLGELLSHEGLARERVAGLWQNAAYQIRAAARTRELLALRGTFQIVEGRVVKANDVKGRVFLNFGTDWRDDFTIIVKPEQRRGLLQLGLDVLLLEGKKVRVRGWIDRRGGPAIELSDAAELAVADELEGAGAPPANTPSAPEQNARPADE